MSKDLLKKVAWIGVSSLPMIAAFKGRDVLGASVGLSLMAFLVTDGTIGWVGEMLAKAGRSGRDLNKPDQPILPESLGLVAGAVYLMTLFMFLPFPFIQWFSSNPVSTQGIFPFQKLGEYTAALLSIISMLFLGFADDVLNLKWRHKILLPALATLPLLIIYKVTYGVTAVVVPLPLRGYIGSLVDLGSLYYCYMALMAIFCTHSINILAGVNGVEVGQSLVIAMAILFNSLISMLQGESIEHAQFAVFLMLPLVSVSLALLKHNWWPAKVFVGDTYCYFTGMAFAVVGILGHYSKTMLLFFSPQLLNFLVSLPQLFGIVPCPRHRLPSLDILTGKLQASRVEVRNPSKMSSLVIASFKKLNLVKEYQSGEKDIRILSNFTILNMLLVWFGPMREDRLAALMMLLQAICCIVAFLVRYYLSTFIFP